MINRTIDEAGQYSLTKYTNKTGGITCAKESDHRFLKIIIGGGQLKKTNKKELRYIITKIVIAFSSLKLFPLAMMTSNIVSKMTLRTLKTPQEDG